MIGGAQNLLNPFKAFLCDRAKGETPYFWQSCSISFSWISAKAVYPVSSKVDEIYVGKFFGPT